MHLHSEAAVELMDIDDTSPARGVSDETPATPRFDLLGPLRQASQREAIAAALFDRDERAEAVAVGRFRLLERLGEGGMGTVYAAYDDRLDRKIAIKLVRAHRTCAADTDERTLREAQALARVSHPNVVHVYEVGEVGAQLFVAMEFLAGPTLRAWLDDGHERSWREILAVLRQAGEGLAAAHAEGVVHRDFKPHNVMFGADGRVRVLDFGLARLGFGEGQALTDVERSEAVGDGLTRSGALLGTPAYMAPEQLRGAPADVRSDVHGFCVTLYEALYGKRPYAGETLTQLADAIAKGRIEAPPMDADVPAWLRKIVLRGLASNPAERFASMPELLDALADEPRERTRRRWAAGALTGLLVASVGLAVTMDGLTPDAETGRTAEREALRSSVSLAEADGVAALVLAIEAAALADAEAGDGSRPRIVDQALYEATPPTWPGVRSWTSPGTQAPWASPRTGRASPSRKRPAITNSTIM